MIPFREILIFILLFFSFHAHSFSFNDKPSCNDRGFPLITNYKTGYYNAHPQNWGIIQDDRGFMYFANGDGVLVYDGNNWELIELKNKEAARALAKDSSGIIYTAGSNELGYLQPNENGKLKYTSLIDSLGFKDIGIVRRILVIDNNIYFRSAEYLIRLNQDGFKYWKAKSSFTIIFAFNKNLYVQDEEFGLYVIDNDSTILAPSGKDFINKRFYFAQQYNDEVILANRIKGLYKYNPSNNEDVGLKQIESDANQSLINDFVYTGIITKEGKVILGTNSGGCIIVDQNGKTLFRITKESGLLQNKIHSLFIDKDNFLWLALDKGVSKCDYSGSITYWNELLGLDGVVQSLIEYNGLLYIGTLQGLYYLNNNKIVKINSGISQTWSFLKYKAPSTNNEILILGTLEGVYVLENNQFVRIPNTKVTYKLYQSRSNPNIIYVGTEDNLSIIEYTQGKFVYKGFIPNSGLSVRSIYEDENRELWLGTFREGVIRIFQSENILAPKNIVNYKFDAGLPSLKNILVYPFNSKLLFSTEQGFYSFDKTLNRFTPDKTFGDIFTGKSKDIFNFTEDPYGNAYITQLNNYHGSIGFANIKTDGSYGWNSQIFNKMPNMMMLVTYLDKNGNFWIGGSEGLYKFDKTFEKSNLNKHFTIIRNVKIGRDSCIFYGNYYTEKNGKRYFTTAQNETLKYNIDYRLNSIKFIYSTPDFSNENELVYQYFLEGYDDKWSDWTTATTKEYTNLHEGRYKFRVISKNIFDINSEESSFEFIIKSPWYRTTIAYLWYLVLVFLFILIIVKISIRKLKYSNIELERLVEIRTAEINLQKEELLTQSEELLAQSEELERSNLELEKLSIVASKTDNAIVIMDKDGNFEWVNEGFTNLYGLTFNEFIEKRGKNIFESISSPDILRELNKCLDKKETVSYEFFYDSPSRKVWAQTTITPILDESNNIVKLIAIDSDITKLKLAEQEIIQHKTEIEAQRDFSEQQRDFIEQQNKELEKHRTRLEQLVNERTSQLEIAKEHAEESDRLKSAFLANMSHEIRTPMNAIIGFSNLMKNGDLSIQEREEFAQQITINSNTLLQLINDIIDISKIESGQLIIVKKNFNLNGLLNELYNSFIQKRDSVYNKDIELILKHGIDSPSFTIYSDPLRLQQILSNLIDNALKFTDNGTVEFGYTIGQESNNPIIKFYVKDSGIGLTFEQQKLIFNRFTKVEDKNKLYRGTGLGLVICKNLVNLLDGRIFVESEIHKGATFFFTIPNNSYSGEIEINPIGKNNEAEYNWQGKKILIAEDENSNYLFLEVILKKTKVSISRALNGLEAIDKFKKNQFDLILMDIKMPIMDGLEATSIIKKLNKEIPIIALTAYAMQNDVNVCIDAGCNDYISKPIAKDKLLSTINKYLK